MLRSTEKLRRFVSIIGSCRCIIHVANVTNGSVLKSNIDSNSEEYQVNYFIYGILYSTINHKYCYKKLKLLYLRECNQLASKMNKIANKVLLSALFIFAFFHNIEHKVYEFEMLIRPNFI